MKLYSKILIGFAVLVLLLQVFNISVFILVPTAMAKQINVSTPSGTKDLSFESLEIQIPFHDLEKEFLISTDDFGACAGSMDSLCLRVPWIAKYLGAAYRYGVILGSIAAVVSLVIGGLMYMVGGLNASMISKSKAMMSGAVIGLVLLLGSYMVLNAVNPNLVKLNSLEVEIVKEAIVPPEFCGTIQNTPEWSKFLMVEGYKEDPTLDNCGDPFPVKLQPGLELEYTFGDDEICRGQSCPKGHGCTNKVTGKYECHAAYIVGDITPYTSNELVAAMSLPGKTPEQSYALQGSVGYLDHLFLVEVDTNGIDFQIGASTYKDKARSFVIKNDEGGEDLIQDFYYLQTEVNDVTSWASNDDLYVLDKSGNAIAYEGELCCTYSCDAEAGPGYMKIEEGCNDISKTELLSAKAPLKININTSKFFCGDWPLSESVGPLLKPLTVVTKVLAEEAISSGDGSQIKQHYAIYDRDKCYFNLQQGGQDLKRPGFQCANDDQCLSGKCTPGSTPSGASTNFCECTSEDSCKSGEFCDTNWGTWDLCYQKRAIGDKCQQGECNEHSFCDDDYKICVPRPPTCETSADCDATSGWDGGSCSGGYCDCTVQTTCGSGFYCADNEGGSAIFNNNDSCTPVACKDTPDDPNACGSAIKFDEEDQKAQWTGSGAGGHW